jgi:hypothetical protein
MTSVSSTTTPSGTTLTEYKFTPSKYVIRIKEIKLHETDPISGSSFNKDNGTRIYYDENYSEHNIATPIELSRNNITKPPIKAFNYVSILIRKNVTMNITAQFGDRSTYYSPYLITSNTAPAWIEIPDTSGPAKDLTINMKYLGSSNPYYSSGNIKAVRLDKDKVVAASSSDVSDIFIRFENPGGPFLIVDKLRFNFNISETTKLVSTNWTQWLIARSGGRFF